MMTKAEALELFDHKPAELARALKISRQAVNNWELDEPIPERRELKIRHEILPQRNKNHAA